MSQETTGIWRIESVIVNSESVLNNAGYQTLEVSGDRIAIQPEGLSFRIEQVTPEGLTLRSEGEIYFADVRHSEAQFHLSFARPGISEQVMVTASSNNLA